MQGAQETQMAMNIRWVMGLGAMVREEIQGAKRWCRQWSRWNQLCHGEVLRMTPLGRQSAIWCQQGLAGGYILTSTALDEHNSLRVHFAQESIFGRLLFKICRATILSKCLGHCQL
jgi:hypothetical protein